jgi:hypothetical protein
LKTHRRTPFFPPTIGEKGKGEIKTRKNKSHHDEDIPEQETFNKRRTIRAQQISQVRKKRNYSGRKTHLR